MTTKIKTSHFLKYELDRFLAFSARHRTDLKPANIQNLHPFADRFSEYIKASERITYCVAKAIEQLENKPRKPYQDIFIYYYLDEYTSFKTAELVGYAMSRYHYFKRQAMNEFTGFFNSFAAKEGLASLIELVN